MSDLYTSLMERLMPVLQENWQVVFIAGGGIFLLGAIFGWRWICDPQGDNTLGFKAFIYRTFGERGYRVLIGMSGICIMLCGGVLWALM